MRLARWSRLLVLPLVAACDAPTAPALPDGAEAFTPPPAYDLWWAMTRECSGRSGSLSDVRWYVVPDAAWIVVDGERYDGYWYGSGNRIVLAEYAMLDGPIVRHEMLHALTGRGRHTRNDFLERCAGVVSCPQACREEAGALPPVDPGLRRVGPEALEIGVALSPQPPSAAHYGGYFTMTVTARNPLGHPVVVTLPPSGDGWPSVSFRYEVEMPGGTLRSAERAWDDGVTRFAAGEVKRQVYDFMIDALWNRIDGGPGTYRFRGAYGGQWAPVSPTVTIATP